MDNIKIIKLNGKQVVKCIYCNTTIKVKDLLECGEKVADVVVCICPCCGKEIILRK